MTMHHHNWMLRACTLLLTGAVCLAGCGGESRPDAAGTVIEAWAHSGQEAERNALRRYVEAFNAANDDITVAITFLPDGAYNAQVQAAALAGDLPDVLEFDGPFVYQYAWQGHLRPMDDLIAPALRDNIIETIIAQGTWQDRLYSVGLFDSALVLYGNRAQLEAAGARIPQGAGDAWSIEEFEEVLAALSQNDDDGQVLDLKMNYSGEWFTYGFYASLISGGGGLIDREDYGTAEGVLDGEAAQGVMARFQRWIRDDGYVDPNIDDNAFTGGRVALSWVGHWMYDAYAEALGDDLVVMPLPDFGAGMTTAMGSWNWAITGKCEEPAAAMRFIAYLMEDAQILYMTKANSAVPATHSAIEAAGVYAEGKPRHLFVEQLTEGYAVPRPRTPAYGVITDVFQSAFQDIANGADIARALDQAANAIDRDIKANEGYPFIEEVQPGGGDG